MQLREVSTISRLSPSVSHVLRKFLSSFSFVLSFSFLLYSSLKGCESPTTHGPRDLGIKSVENLEEESISSSLLSPSPQSLPALLLSADLTVLDSPSSIHCNALFSGKTSLSDSSSLISVFLSQYQTTFPSLSPTPSGTRSPVQLLQGVSVSGLFPYKSFYSSNFNVF